MIILSLDPGHTTGWCKIDVVENQPSYVFSGNISVKNGNLAHALRHLLNEDLDAVIIERLPHNLPPIMSTVRTTINEATKSYEFLEISVEVGPGEWKPVTRRYPLPKLDWRTTQHERDAWRMGVFWLWKEGLVKI